MKCMAFLVWFTCAITANAADMVPSISARISAGAESPTDTDLTVTITNSTGNSVLFIGENDVADQWEALHIRVTTAGGPVEETTHGKAIKARDERTGSTNECTIQPGEKHDIVIPLSRFFMLPAHGGFTVSGTADDVLLVGEKVMPFQFSAVKFVLK